MPLFDEFGRPIPATPVPSVPPPKGLRKLGVAAIVLLFVPCLLLYLRQQSCDKLAEIARWMPDKGVNWKVASWTQRQLGHFIVLLGTNCMPEVIVASAEGNPNGSVPRMCEELVDDRPRKESPCERVSGTKYRWIEEAFQIRFTILPKGQKVDKLSVTLFPNSNGGPNPVHELEQTQPWRFKPDSNVTAMLDKESGGNSSRRDWSESYSLKPGKQFSEPTTFKFTGYALYRETDEGIPRCNHPYDAKLSYRVTTEFSDVEGKLVATEDQTGISSQDLCQFRSEGKAINDKLGPDCRPQTFPDPGFCKK